MDPGSGHGTVIPKCSLALPKLMTGCVVLRGFPPEERKTLLTETKVGVFQTQRVKDPPADILLI